MGSVPDPNMSDRMMSGRKASPSRHAITPPVNEVNWTCSADNGNRMSDILQLGCEADVKSIRVDVPISLTNKRTLSCGTSTV